ncbi:hypothetical protein KP509_13G007100 [Ceratopteris richardii]|uniref:Uncharacterized protein n=1 Tax=Ceratopteris richardii TaxID=49495 RepID=A0A8T2TB36_CERRI|nr:hypothetical protein KP509_13G007100 [Ceratopteris richardii]
MEFFVQLQWIFWLHGHPFCSPEPLIFEFPEIMGHSRRDYWLAIIRELVCVHQLIRKYQMEDVDKVEALSRALLGIVRLQATRELVHGLPFKFESLLTFLTCEHLHGGDLILKAIAKNFSSRKKRVNGRILQRSPFSAISANSVSSNPATSTNPSCVVGTVIPVGEFLIGDLTPLEKAVLQSRGNAKLAELAQSTIASVKMGGIDTNLAVMKELSLPFIHAWEWIRELQSWNDPLKTITFLLICSYILLKNYHGYVIPVGLICFSGSLLWIRQDQGKNAGDVNVLAPSPNAMEQLFNLQQALFDLENNLRMGNISLLKVRAILFSRVPQVTNQVIVSLVIVACFLAVMPFRFLLLLVLWETFTRYTYIREESTELLFRRAWEWWNRVPVVSVQLLKIRESKKRI